MSAQTTPSDIHEVDWLVFGAGAGGMAAALAGALQGLQVLVCEKSDQVGGATATSAGTLWIPENKASIAAGFSGDSKDDAREYLDSLIGTAEPGRTLREVYLQEGPDIIEWFEQRSDVQFMACGEHPDYLAKKGAAIAGRAIIPKPFDGRLLGRNFFRVRAPIPEFMVLGGMMVGKLDIPALVHRFKSIANFWYASRLLFRYVTDRLRYTRGTRLMLGNALVARLYSSLLACKVPVLFNAELDSLITDDGRVTGAEVLVNGKRQRILARRGVVLATGGFANNASLRHAFMPNSAPDSMAVPENQGKGIAAAMDIGALTQPEKHGGGVFWTPVSRTGSGQWAGLFPHLVMDRAKPGLIAVNSAGKRFVNEAVSYHHFVEAMFESNKTVPTIPAWLVCENSFVNKYGLGAIHPGTKNLVPFERKGWVVQAETLQELAAKMNVNCQGLTDTVRRHNGFAATGIDEDFEKGTTELNRFNGDSAHGPNACIGAIESGPYCAMAVWPAEIACSTGLETDVNARVLNQRGQPMVGLYACGNDLASIMQGTYPGPGTTLGPALVFGYKAAHHAANQCQQN